MTARRTDGNQTCIVRALRMNGCLVQSLADVGKGTPDLLVIRHGEPYLLEVKMPHASLTPDETHWHEQAAAHGYTVAIVHSPEEALQAVNAI